MTNTTRGGWLGAARVVRRRPASMSSGLGAGNESVVQSDGLSAVHGTPRLWERQGRAGSCPDTMQPDSGGGHVYRAPERQTVACATTHL